MYVAKSAVYILRPHPLASRCAWRHPENKQIRNERSITLFIFNNRKFNFHAHQIIEFLLNNFLLYSEAENYIRNITRMDNLLKCDIFALLFCLHIETPAYSSVCILLKLNWNFELTFQFEVSYDLCKCFTVKLNEFPRAVLFLSPPPTPRSVKCFHSSLD